MNYKPVLLLFVLIVPIALAETTGNISTEDLTVPPVTGLWGWTVDYCNSTADCGDYFCFRDWDGESVVASQGWCNLSSITSCMDDGTWRANAYSFCDDSTRRWCSSGNWNSETCSYGCANGTCNSASTTDGTTSYDNVTTTQTASITITSYPSDFNITQNESTTKSLKVKNNGDFILYNITLELSGIGFYSITPTKINNLSIGSEDTFSISFNVPANTTVKEYTVTADVKTSSAATASAAFKVRIIPSEETVETDIIPLYQECLSILEGLENNITKLEEKGINTTDIRALFNSIKDKLNQTNSSLENEDYYTANQLLNDVNTKIEELKNMISSAELGEVDFTIVIVVAVIVIIAAVVITYLFWPVRQGYRYKGTGTDVKDLLKKIKEKRRYESKK